jgi:hypothetical protein
MNGNTISDLMIRLRKFISDAYDDNEFGMLLFENLDDKIFDYASLPSSWGHEVKVLETVKWANRYGGTTRILWLARIARDGRPERSEFQQLVKDIEQIIQVAEAALPPLASSAGALPPSLPPELAGPLGLFAEQSSTLANLARDLRIILRTTSYQSFDLAGRFHLSESEGERLTAVLALEKAPDPGYLRWLAERVTVEKPLIGLMAAQALVTASLWLNQRDLGRIGNAISDATDLLDGLADADEQPAVGNVAARKRQLQAALSLVEMRSRNGRSMLPPADLEGFLSALISTFDRDGFDGLFQRRLQSSLKWVANLNDPIELIVVNVVLTARDFGWERELIRAAYEERKDHPTFAALHKKYEVDGTTGI